MKKSIFFLTLVFLTVTLSCGGGGSSSGGGGGKDFSGLVVDWDTDSPIAGVKISYDGWETTSGGDGRFIVSGVKSDTYFVFSHPEYKTQSLIFFYAGGNNDFGKVRMYKK
jgi:hypothetical protein